MTTEKPKAPAGAWAFTGASGHTQEQLLGKKGLPSLVKKSGNPRKALDLPLRAVSGPQT